MKHNKRAQVEIQFNWIFVIIAGSVLLGFFFMMIASQSSVSEQKVSVSLARNFKTILDATAQKAGTFKEYQFPSTLSIEFECNDGANLHNYKLNDLKAGDIKYDIIFAPEKLTGRNVFTWTKEWELPDEQGFSVTNFLYLTNKLQGYFFVYDLSDDFKNLYKGFPQNSSIYEYVDEDYTYLNLQTYKYIFLHNEKEEILQLPDINTGQQGDKAKFIIIKPDDNVDLFRRGTVYYCDEQPTNSLERCPETIYLGSASLYAAIFSDDKDYYECMMDKAFHKLKITTMLQYNRIAALNDSLSISCKNYLGLIGLPGPEQWLRELSGYENEDGGFTTGAVDDPFDNYKEIDGILADLHNRNRILESERDCLELY